MGHNQTVTVSCSYVISITKVFKKWNLKHLDKPNNISLRPWHSNTLISSYARVLFTISGLTQLQTLLLVAVGAHKAHELPLFFPKKLWVYSLFFPKSWLLSRAYIFLLILCIFNSTCTLNIPNNL